MNKDDIYPYSKSFFTNLSKTFNLRQSRLSEYESNILNTRSCSSFRTNTATNTSKLFHTNRCFPTPKPIKSRKRSHSDSSIRYNINDGVIVEKYIGIFNNVVREVKTKRRMSLSVTPWLSSTSNTKNLSISEVKSNHRSVKVKSAKDITKLVEDTVWRKCPWPTVNPQKIIEHMADKSIDVSINQEIDKSLDTLSMVSSITYNKSINRNRSYNTIKSKDLKHLILPAKLITYPSNNQSINVSTKPNKRIVKNTMVVLRTPITRLEMITSINKQLGLLRLGGLSDIIIKQTNFITKQLNNKITTNTNTNTIHEELENSINKWIDNNMDISIQNKTSSFRNSMIDHNKDKDITFRSLALNTIEDNPILSNDCEFIIYVGGINSSENDFIINTNLLTPIQSQKTNSFLSTITQNALSKAKHFFSTPKKNSLLGVNYDVGDDYEYTGYINQIGFESDSSISLLYSKLDKQLNDNIDDQFSRKIDYNLDNQIEERSRVTVSTEFIPVSNVYREILSHRQQLSEQSVLAQNNNHLSNEISKAMDKYTNLEVINKPYNLQDIQINSPIDKQINDNGIDDLDHKNNSDINNNFRYNYINNSDNNVEYNNLSSDIDSNVKKDEETMKNRDNSNYDNKTNSVDIRLDTKLEKSTENNSSKINIMNNEDLNKKWTRQVQLDLTDLLEDF